MSKRKAVVAKRTRGLDFLVIGDRHMQNQSHDEWPNQAVAQSPKRHLAAKVIQGNRVIYERRVGPD